MWSRWSVRVESQNLARKLFYSKWVKIYWILWFSRMSEAWKEVRLSEEIPGIRRYREVRTVTSDVKLYRPGNAERVIWHWADSCSYQFKSFEHLSKSILVLWSWAMLEAQDLWSHLNAFDDNLIEAWLIIKDGVHCLVNYYSISWSEMTVDEDSLKFQLRV